MQTCVALPAVARFGEIDRADIRTAQIQKGAVLIVGDQKVATAVATSALALAITLACSGAARAVESPPVPPAASNGTPTSNGSSPWSGIAAEPGSVTVTLVENGVDVRVATTARTVGGLLDERNERPAEGDYLAPAADEALAPGMRIVFRQAAPVAIRIGKQTRSVRSSAATVGDLLAEQHIDVSGDDVAPPLGATPPAHGTVVVVPVSRWTSHVREAIAPAVMRRDDKQLAFGVSHVVERGKAGLRETTFEFVKHGDRAPVRTLLASHVIVEPRATIVLRGVGAYQSLAHVAEQGFASAVHFAGTALHMIATAYTAGCYGCSGMTATGLRAGFGIIAVDPSIIPLGTKLFIPGYGKAIAGDTGGAIHGNRIDLGFNSNGQALQWGNRPVTVYLLR